MPRPHEVRTFIYLPPRELDFIRVLQRLVLKRTGRKRPPPLHRIIQSVLIDYRRMLENGASPNLLMAYIDAKVGRHLRKSASAAGRANRTALPLSS